MGVPARAPKAPSPSTSHLGRVFARGCLASVSRDAVASTVRPHVEAILASALEEIVPYKPLLRALLGKPEELGMLLLWVTHYDLNDVSVLIDEDCQGHGGDRLRVVCPETV